MLRYRLQVPWGRWCSSLASLPISSFLVPSLPVHPSPSVLCSSCSLCFRFCRLPTLPLAPLSPSLPCSFHSRWVSSRCPCSSRFWCRAPLSLRAPPHAGGDSAAGGAASRGHGGAVAGLIHRAVTQTAHTDSPARTLHTQPCIRNRVCIPAAVCCQRGVKNTDTHRRTQTHTDTKRSCCSQFLPHRHWYSAETRLEKALLISAAGGWHPGCPRSCPCTPLCRHTGIGKRHLLEWQPYQISRPSSEVLCVNFLTR